MEFGILGPLTISEESGARTVTAAKQRVILAVLLLRAGQPVPVESLTELLWNGYPPASAVLSLRNYIMRLRRALGAAGERILSRDGGYLIDVAEDELDLLRFDRFRKEGAAAFERGDLALASGSLTRALGQWRGPALCDVDSDPLQRDECPRLTADRVDTLELKLEVEHAIGRYSTSLGELRHFASAHPERESLGEHLILALLQNGRRAEADAEYHRIRQTLQTEFGVAPGARLRALHRRLSGAVPAPVDVVDKAPRARLAPVDVSDRAPRARTAGGPSVPFQIPADLADFTGRDRETAAAVALLGPAGPRAGGVIVITGRAGIGKSSLAIHIAHALSASYPDGILYTGLRTEDGERVPSGQALLSLLEAFERDPRSVPDGTAGRSALLRSHLAGRRVLIVLDGATDSAQVRPLLPSTPRSAALVTSRLRLDDLAGARHMELALFSQAESAQLVSRIAGRDRITAEPKPMQDLYRACGNLPLALRIAGSRLAARPSWSVRTLADRLADRSRRLDELRTGQLDVRACLASSYRSLPTTAAAALPRLAATDKQPLSVQDAAALLGVPRPRAEQVLECLVDHRFLATARSGSYHFPAFVREFAREQALVPARTASPVDA
ncbi:winged helix-turn-helix domain-containing protein [Actinospica sp. MGRD01-02]|uniref:Winged helix-turn-helix domain-containing protein n=1 Tax=Actinospica acidithermotolerans TaxID=2828514 RepID=A0A941E6X7_9ACTN|nr:AfsR/SARP family transcriptional regulator [Actinospica acidithermotolerans]MBR7825053.1 winged helix-turn-helix domain-containing protein [Actinospica acidithermotolerans]